MVLLALLALFSAPQDSTEANLLIRTDDLMNELEIDFISFDRLSFTAYSPEYGYFSSQPTFVIDGLPAEVSFFGLINPYHLPFITGTFKENREESFFDTSQYGSGVIRMNSVTQEPGFSFYGGVNISNETGEPGPWVFDPERVTPNIERFGPGVDLELQLAGERFYGKGQFRFHRQMNTNLSVERRMKNMVSLPEEGEWLRAEAITQTGMIETGYRGDRFLVRARTLIAASDDFLYFQPLGREIPSRPGLHQTTLAAEGVLSDQWKFEGYAQLTDKEIGFRRNLFAHDFDWQEQTREIFTSIGRNGEDHSLSVGSRYRAIATDAPGVDGNSRHYLELLFDLNQKLNRSMRAKAGQGVTFHSGSPAIHLHGGLRFQNKPSRQTTADIKYSERLPEFSNPSADLITRGYDIDHRFGIPIDSFGSPGKSRLLTMSLSHSLELNDEFKVTGSLMHITHFALHVPFQPVLYDEALHTMPGTFMLFSGEAGRRGNAEFKISHKAHNNFYHTIRTVYSATLSGGGAYRDYWKHSPDVWIRYSAVYSPFRDVELKAQIRYRSGTTWSEFDNLDGESFRSFNVQYPTSFGEFTNRPPSHLNADLTAAKWFWKQHLRIILSGKNILNRDYFPHPLAVREGFTFSLKAEMRF